MRGPLHVTKRGDRGPVVAFVHGVVMTARMTFGRQKPLAEAHQLLLVDRRGYGESPPVRRREDFEVDAEDLLATVPEGAHLVALSYGTVGALLAAAQEPARWSSLTLIECPVFALAPGDPEATRTHGQLRRLWSEPTLDDHEFLVRFNEVIGLDVEVRDPLPAPLDETVPMLRRHRHAWEVELPLDALAGLPTLVVTSGEHAAFDAVADHLAAVLDAGRKYLPGAGHLVPLVGQPLNDLLARFVASTEQGAAP